MIICQKCKRDCVLLDTDSFETKVPIQNTNYVEMEAKVTGYCVGCSAEHTFVVRDQAVVVLEE